MNMYNCNKCNEVEEAHGALLVSLLNVRYTNCCVPEFQEDEIKCMFHDVCQLILMFYGNASLPSKDLLFHSRLFCCAVIVSIFTEINMLIF